MSLSCLLETLVRSWLGATAIVLDNVQDVLSTHGHRALEKGWCLWVALYSACLVDIESHSVQEPTEGSRAAQVQRDSLG
jgi:hypothetical protein